MESKLCIITRLTRKGRRKLSGNRGVSIMEMLLCVLILLLSTGVTVSTLDLGIGQFRARTRESEQRLLCNTLSLAAQEYLTYANKIEINEDGTLKRLKTGAIGSALESRWCAFVTGFYKVENNKIKFERNPSGVTEGALAIAYSKDDAAQYYDLANYSQYIARRSGTDVNVKLHATLTVEVDRANKRFNVTIRVASTDTVRTTESVNEFIVIPIHSGVIPDP